LQLPFLLLILLSVYAIGIWAGLVVTKRVVMQQPAKMPVWVWWVYFGSIKAFVFLMVVIVVTTPFGLAAVALASALD
jgi:hypothetical protein